MNNSLLKNSSNKSIKRIQILLDNTSDNNSIIEAAILIASAYQAEITALYIENSTLATLADTPFAREIRITTATRRHLDSANIKRTIRSHAVIAQQRVELKAKRAQLPLVFKTTKIDKMIDLLSSTQNGNLIIYAKSVTATLTNKNIFSALSRLIEKHNHPVMLLKRAITNKHPICILLDLSRCSAENISLELAANLAMSYRVMLKLVCYSADNPNFQTTLRNLSELLNRYNITFCLTILENTSSQDIITEIKRISAKIIVIDKHSLFLNKSQKIELIDSLVPSALLI